MKICIIGAGPSTYYLTNHIHTHAPSTTIHVFEKNSSPLQSLKLFHTKPTMRINNVLCNIKVHKWMFERLSAFYDGIVVAVGGRARRLDGALNKFAVYGEDVVRKGGGLEGRTGRSARLLESVLESKRMLGRGRRSAEAMGLEKKNKITKNKNNEENENTRKDVNSREMHESLVHAKPFSRLRRVAIVGAGNVSLDVANMLYEQGVPQIFILSRNELAKCAFGSYELRRCMHDKNVRVWGGTVGNDRRGMIVGERLRKCEKDSGDEEIIETENESSRNSTKIENNKIANDTRCDDPFYTSPTLLSYNPTETSFHNQSPSLQPKQTLYLLLNTVLQSIKKNVSLFNLALKTREGTKMLNNVDLVVNCTGYTGRDLSTYVCTKPLYFLGWCKDAKGNLSVVKGRAVELGDRMIDEMGLK
ncbi:Ferredoxin/adrenodoxin reductase [Trachipleistophora hominis]|uniref:Ferredoxin/adrenodoxin reductase n=1 Tax=Trachipleistophora hominis TaxID=72359 RepID=L7JTE0_TRAHO|nr:Ferredoxin/adrenodoxin reductase [Trachipleistophora hominis]